MRNVFTDQELQQLADERGISVDRLLEISAYLEAKQRAIAAIEGITFFEAGNRLIAWQESQLQQLRNQQLEWDL